MCERGRQEERGKETQLRVTVAAVSRRCIKGGQKCRQKAKHTRVVFLLKCHVLLSTAGEFRLLYVSVD